MLKFPSTGNGPVKKQIKRSLRRLGIDVRRYIPERDPVYSFQQLVRTISPVVYVDVGCNRGQFFEEYVKPIDLSWSEAIFVDPIEEAVDSLKRKHEGTSLQARYYVAAVSDHPEEVQLNISARETSSSILTVTEESIRRIEETGRKETRWVRQDTLPGLLERSVLPGAALMKIDVQGAEKEVLEGLGAMLNQVAVLRMEMSSVELYRGQALGGDLLAWLNQREFEIVGMEPGWMDAESGICVQWDVTLVPRSRLNHIAS